MFETFIRIAINGANSDAQSNIFMHIISLLWQVGKNKQLIYETNN